MANHKATKKDTRQANKRRERNRYHGKTTRNAMRDLMAITSAGEAKAKHYRQLSCDAWTNWPNAKLIHKNKAANLKSALAKNVNNLSKVVEAVAAKPKAAKKKAAPKKAKK
jgi:small subunit ribosomal protein S20